MTLGIDVSRLFTDMIMAIETKDIVVKKMVYLYLSKYAHNEPEMAIMCINSFLREWYEFSKVLASNFTFYLSATTKIL